MSNKVTPEELLTEDPIPVDVSGLSDELATESVDISSTRELLVSGDQTADGKAQPGLAYGEPAQVSADDMAKDESALADVVTNEPKEEEEKEAIKASEVSNVHFVVAPESIQKSQEIKKAMDDQADELSSLVSEDLGERETWTGRLDFLLSCIGFAVGLGNIWRFPYLCYSSGGGAFLIPYAFFLITCALPLFFLECSYGQFASLSPVTVWRISPLFKGIGYGMVIISGIVCIYYNIIMTWTFYFLFKSMQRVLPWSNCDNEWNTEHCVVSVMHNDSVSAHEVHKKQSASEEFWRFNVLERTNSIDDFGTIRWPLFGCLALAWVVVFLCLCKGVKSSGKVVYVTATFPYIILTILLVRGVTLNGAGDGIKFYLVPQWHRLREFKVWGSAAVQIFYSVGMAWGGLITMSSYNKFNNNVYKDSMMVPLINCATSVYAGFVIFSVLGFMAYVTRKPIESVVTQGPGLIFMAYPEAVAKMPAPQLWAILFFLMIFTLGLDSQFAMFETMTSAFIDEYPDFLRKKKVGFTALMCIVEFGLGIPMVFQGGMYVLQIMDWYCATFSLMLLSFFECMIISWIYGVDRFMKDIRLMIGFKPCILWKYMWMFFTPLIVLFTWFFSVSSLQPVSLGDYKYPYWAILFGWLLGLCSLVPVPVCALKILMQETTGTLVQKIMKLIQPSALWGPAKAEDFERYLDSMNQYERERYGAALYGLDRKRYLAIKAENENMSNIGYLQDTTLINMGPFATIMNIQQKEPNKKV